MENGPLNISDSEAARNVTPLARHSDISIQLTLVLAFTVLPLGEIKADILVDANNSSGQQQTVTAPNDYTQTTDLIDNSGFAVDINSTNGANGTLEISSGMTLSANASTVVVRAGATLSAFDVQGTLISNSFNALIANPTSTINTFTNSGTIQAQTTNFAAIYLPGAVTNLTNTGLIEHTAGSTALVIDNVTTLVNDSSGSIIGTDAVGVRLGFASPGTIGSFTNNGSISGGTTAVEFGFSPGSTAGITNSGTITGVVDGLEVRNGSELTFFDNTGGTIESTGASGAGLHLSEDQDTGVTNAGILRSTSTGNGLLLDTEAQTRDFTNSGTISSVSGTAIVSQTAMTGDINGFVNGGTITGGGGIAIDARDAFTLTNSGTITGDISHTTAGVLTIDHTDGAIVGGITSVVDAAHSLSFGGGTVNGNVTLDGITANTFVLGGTAITGNVDLGDGAAHAVSLSRGSISGLLDIGSETTALSINAAAGDNVTIGTLATNDTTTTNINGAGDVNITTFTVNGTANQSAGTLTAGTLSVGTSGTFNQSGTSVLDVATLNLDGAAMLNLNGTGARITGAISGSVDSAVVVNGNFSSEDTINVGRMEIANGGVLNVAYDVTTTSPTAFAVNGTANQSAGMLTAAALSVGTNGTFNQSGTSVLDVAALNLDGTATLNLNGNGARVTGAIVGTTDSAIVVNGSFSSEDAITAGRMEIANGGTLNVAHDVTSTSPTAFVVDGIANQSAGTLTAAALSVGTNGTFNQSGTSVLDVATLNLDGTLNLNGNGARVTGAITGTADSAVIISGSFSSEDAINVGRLEIAGGGTFNAAHDITTTSSSAFSNLGTLVIDAGDTVTIAGDYSQGADGIFQTNVANDTSFGRLVVAGTANLPSNARIDVNVADTDFNFSVNELQDIITAGTLVSDGTFSVSDNSNLFDFHAILSGNTVDLCLAAAGGSCGSRSSIGVYEAVVANRNWPGIGAAIVFDDLIDSFVADATSGNDGMDNVIASLGAFGTQKEVSDAVTQTLPLLAAGSSIPIRNVLSSTRRIVQFGLRDNSRLSWEEDRDLSNGNIWANVYRTHHNQNDRSGATGFYGISEGLVIGVDGNTDAHSNLGIAFAYGSTDVDNNTDLHSADIKTYQLIGYGRHSVSESAEVSIQIGLSKSKTEGRRTIAFADDAPTALSDYDTTGIHLGIGIGRALKLGSATQFIPTMHMDYTRLTSDGYTETGAETLNINARSTHLEAFELGLNGQLRHRINAKASLVASFGIAYDTLNEQPTVTGRFAGGGDAFVTRGIHPSPWIGGASIDFPITLGNNKYVTIGYDVEARRSYDNHTASMEFRWRF